MKRWKIQRRRNYEYILTLYVQVTCLMWFQLDRTVDWNYSPTLPFTILVLILEWGANWELRAKNKITSWNCLSIKWCPGDNLTRRTARIKESTGGKLNYVFSWKLERHWRLRKQELHLIYLFISHRGFQSRSSINICSTKGSKIVTSLHLITVTHLSAVVIIQGVWAR